MSSLSFGQDLIMQNGTFNRCAPDRFFDSGGITGNYSSNENFTITICPTNPGEVVSLNFTEFRTQVNEDILTIYDGDSTASTVIGNFSGTVSPGNVNSTHSSGCLTISFSSNGFGNTSGWEADIICAQPCQTITASIDSTNPSVNTTTNQIEILPGQTVDFIGSATFSDTGANATYLWNFGTGATDTTTSTSHQFDTPGTYNVTFTVSDDNPLGCSDTATVTVFVADSIVTINNAAFPESFLPPDQLIEDVLVTGGCSSVDNFVTQVFGGPADNTTKSYGYFSRGGATGFPFVEGIVITSGSAFNGGNNVITTTLQGQNGLSGDADLESSLGITNTQDATFIQFDFTPTADNISFRYLLASEEYDGTTECNFADGFAFLLREAGSGDPYQNLAVLPDGTPVNVTNINQSTTCPANPDFFDGYNIGDTNYNGRTEVLTASANVTANVTYEIKLVVADQGDDIFDTAIFIEAGSFNLGGELGEDITLANGTAVCGGGLEDITLDTQAPSAAHTWFLNGSEIVGETGSTLTIEEPGFYEVTVNFGGTCEVMDSITVEFRESPEIVAPAEDLSGCSGTGVAEFNLEQNTPIVFGSQSTSEFAVTYHNSLADAQTGDNPIPNINNYDGTDGELIYVRIDDIATESCVVTDEFELNVFTSVTAENTLYELCDNDADGDDTNGIVEFTLNTQDDEVLGTQDPTQFSVSYHINNMDAMDGANPLPNLYTNATANTQIIYARVQNNNNIDCFETSEVTLQVNALPTITASVDLRQCDDDTDGISSFNLTEANDLISTNAINETFTYHLNFADADNGASAITNETAYENTDASAAPDLLFVRVENSDGCHRVAELELFVSTSQIPAGFFIPTYEECDDTRVDDNITDGITIFDFSSATPLIEALFPVGQNITVTYYESTEDALAEQNAIPDPSSHINTASPFNQTIVYRVENDDDNSCQGIGEFELQTINPTPRTDTESVDLFLCDDVTIGDLSEEFDLTQNETFIFDGQPDLDATYFITYEDALNNVVANEIPAAETTAYMNTSPTQTIYVRVENTMTGCFAIVDFDITVSPLPDVVPVIPLEECENGTDGIFTFDLGQKRPEILNGQDPNMFTVTFHINQNDADNLNNPQPDMFTNTVNPLEIFYAITNDDTGCSNSTGSFFIEVFEGAQANPDGEPLDFERCDDNIENDGVAQFDLNTLQDEVLDGQDPAEYTITYHFSEMDAIDDENPLPFLYENLTNPQTIWVRVSNNISPDLCFEVQPVPLRVNPIPDFELEDLYILCTTTNGSEVVPVPPVIDTRLPDSDFSFEWSLDGVIIATETSSSLIPTQGGTYSVTVTDTSTSTLTQCQRTEETIVLESEPPIVIAEVTSQAFSGNHVIEAATTNTGDFEWSLDNGPWQDSGVFENVTGGTHVVYARDINGCGIGSDTVIVIDYPNFFTPNGDGNHDTWNIIGIDTQPNAKIYIFDRYGKLLKQLSPTSPGWDGTYQGNRVPTDDYWFVVEYTEPTTGETKQQRAHFTLKR